jgi:hypothetical protein
MEAMRFCVVLRSVARDVYYFGDRKDPWPFSVKPGSAYCFDTIKDANYAVWELSHRLKLRNKIEVIPESEVGK